MRRFEDWELRLFGVKSVAVSVPHEWGVHDCALFSADCVLAMTGEDPMLGFRGRYKTRIGAARVIRSSGYSSLGDMVADRLLEISVSEAGRGDVVLCEGPEGEFLAIVEGHTAIGPAAHGLQSVRLAEQAVRAFKVG